MCQRPEWDGPKTRPTDGQLCCHWRWVLHVVQTPQTKKDIFKRMTKRGWYVVTFNAKKYVLNSLLLRQWEAMSGNDPIRCRFEPSIFWMIWTNKSILNTYIFLQRGNYVGTENKFLWSKKRSQTCAFTSQHNIYIFFRFVFQTFILALMSTVHRSESARHIVLTKHAVCVSKTVPPIKTQCALRTGQHTTTNAGTSSATARGWTITLCITWEVVKVSKRQPTTKNSP